MPSGGKRTGSGRPRTGRKRHEIVATDDEWEIIKMILKQLRKMYAIKETKNERLKKSSNQ